MEKDDEISGEGDEYDFGARIYDARIGRFLAIDPITDKYPELTPYQFASNTPIQAVDLDGEEAWYYANGKLANVRGPLDAAYVHQNQLYTEAQIHKMQNNMVPATLGTIGSLFINVSNERAGYVKKVAALEKYKNADYDERVKGSRQRNKLVLQTRKKTAQPFRNMTEQIKPGQSMKIKPDGRFWVTNPNVNNFMKVTGYTGRLLFLYGGYESYNNISNSDDKVKAITEEGGAWAGAAIGGKAGAAFGTYLGGPIGGFVGLVSGSVAGAIAGKKVASSIVGEQGPAPDYTQRLNPSDHTGHGPVIPIIK